jgi:hypothetical protein
MEELLSRRIEEESPLIQVLIGPRQIGKTTALNGALAGRGLYFSADFPTPTPAERIHEWWKQAEAHPDRLLAIDEVQKIPAWSEEVKRLWDRSSRRIKLILTGSSSPIMEKGLSESLAGRFELIRAEHWNWREAREYFGLTLEQFIEFGCYPGAAPFLADLERWGSYVRDAIVEPAIGRDLLQLSPVENPALLRQVFGVALSLPAQVISLQKIQGQLQDPGAIATISNYLRLLSQAFLVSGVQKYVPFAFRSRQSSPKLIVHDNSLIRAFERPIDIQPPRERLGRYLENAVGSRLIEAGWETYYWKDRSLEVDFVALGPRGERWALEVKLGAAEPAELQSLLKFCDRYRDFSPAVVGLTEIRIPGVRWIPAESLLGLSRYSRSSLIP